MARQPILLEADSPGSFSADGDPLSGRADHPPLLTPNEGLSAKHLREFEKAGIEAEIFNKDGPGLFAGQAVESLEVTKLKEDMGEKTAAVDAFERNKKAAPSRRMRRHNDLRRQEFPRGNSGGVAGVIHRPFDRLRDGLRTPASPGLRPLRPTRSGSITPRSKVSLLSGE